MKFKDVAISDASTEAKVAALAVLLDKELLKLAETVFNVQKIEGPKGEQGLQGPKGEQGDRGFDGTNGKDGTNGANGRDGKDGKQGVGVQDAHIDFDGSLIITLTDGKELNVGEVVPMDVAEKIKIIGNGGGTSQSVLDAIASLQAVDASYGTMAQQDANAVAITGGTINGATVGATTPAAGTFTTLTSNGATTFTNGTAIFSIDDGAGTSSQFRLIGPTSTLGRNRLFSPSQLRISAGSTNAIQFHTAAGTSPNSDGNVQLAITNTASAVNYVQVTGAATGNRAAISAQGSDTNVGINYLAKGSGLHVFAGQNGSVQFVVNPAASAVNYWQGTGSATNIAPSLAVVGSDTNISQVFQSKGTGAIDLAAGSRGVNISNGGTVTAYTRTNPGTNLWLGVVPTVTVSAPTTAGGVQAVLAVQGYAASATIQAGGTGYTVGDTLTLVGGTGGVATFTVATVSAGVITSVAPANFGQYSVAPTNPVSVTGGTGSGATLNVSYGLGTSYTITNAGSGYVEQPTLTISGQTSGSGAAAYATVGSGTVVKSIGSTMLFQTPGGTAFGVTDIANSVNYIRNQGSSSGFQVFSTVQGADTNTSYAITSKGNGAVSLYTNLGNQLQFTVAHTASAVNYVQVTGAATGSGPIISAQGSDTNVDLLFSAKGTAGSHVFRTNNTVRQFQVNHVTSAVNYGTVTGNVAGSAPVYSVAGSDTNIDLTLTPKGTGNVRFGTYTADMTLVVQGYITIKDSGGTVRKLAVIA